MNAIVLVVERHADGKLYPPRWWDLPAAQVERARGLEHALRCGLHLPYREVQRRLLDQYGIRRSLGVIFKDIARYECGQCVPELTPPQPDPRMKARPVQWR